MADEVHNRVQQDCTDLEIDDVEFVMGSVYGLRQWRVSYNTKTDFTTRLFGHYGSTWDLGEVNVAVCGKKDEFLSERVSFSASAFAEAGESVLPLLVRELHRFAQEHPRAKNITVIPLPTFFGTGFREMRVSEQFLQNPEMYPNVLPWKIERSGSTFKINDKTYIYTHLDFRIQGFSPRLPHPISHPKCTCGFYAYNNRASLLENSEASYNSVFGIIKAYGNVTHGTKGFRAEKAEVVSLTRPLRRRAVDGLLEWVDLSEPDEIFRFQQIVPNDIPVYDTLSQLFSTFPEER